MKARVHFISMYRLRSDAEKRFTVPVPPLYMLMTGFLFRTLVSFIYEVTFVALSQRLYILCQLE